MQTEYTPPFESTLNALSELVLKGFSEAFSLLQTETGLTFATGIVFFVFILFPAFVCSREWLQNYRSKKG